MNNTNDPLAVIEEARDRLYVTRGGVATAERLDAALDGEQEQSISAPPKPADAAQSVRKP